MCRVRLARPKRPALKNNNLRLGKAGTAQLGRQLADKGRASNPGRITEQVIGGKQRVGLAATELGLQPVYAGRCHIPDRRAVSSRKNASRFSVRYVFSQNVTGIQVVGRAPATIYQAKVRSEQ